MREPEWHGNFTDMFGVLLGYVIILTVISAGYLLARKKVIGAGKERLVLNRVAFYAVTPVKLFVVLAKSKPQEIFTPVLAVLASSTLEAL
ncbi:hypothetical protein [Corynebacterium freiburgense]|uniref:hypothetical protein n=1 Tax=Corynebacterium freiburgense TaxID=556548 RepID=UPI00146FB6C2|nr:hypothetical protein [Corynebacterium freiburgense]